MSETAGYGRVDCLNALDNNDGNIDKALLELEKKALEPIRKRVLGNQDGLDGKEGNSDGVDSGEDRKIEAEVTNKNVSFEVSFLLSNDVMIENYLKN